jgi:hypothetical protein
MMGGTESDILADATELLEGGYDDLEDDAIGGELDSPEKPSLVETKTEEVAAPKKKVSIKRDSALPVVQ